MATNIIPGDAGALSTDSSASEVASSATEALTSAAPGSEQVEGHEVSFTGPAPQLIILTGTTSRPEWSRQLSGTRISAADASRHDDVLASFKPSNGFAVSLTPPASESARQPTTAETLIRSTTNRRNVATRQQHSEIQGRRNQALAILASSLEFDGPQADDNEFDDTALQFSEWGSDSDDTEAADVHVALDEDFAAEFAIDSQW